MPEQARGQQEYYDCLLIDDEEALSLATCEYFEMFGTSVYWASNSESGLRFFKNYETDLVLLDINLIETSGFDLCKKIRKFTDVPILFISARQSDDDRLLAFSSGGDDYIQKPYSLSVLLAKVTAVLTRYRTVSRDDSEIVRLGDLILNKRDLSVTQGNKKIDLKPKEFKLLNYLMRNPGRTISKDELLNQVWRDAITSENTLNVHIRRLRGKLGEDYGDHEYIKTSWGTGYSFVAKEDNC